MSDRGGHLGARGGVSGLPGGVSAAGGAQMPWGICVTPNIFIRSRCWKIHNRDSAIQKQTLFVFLVLDQRAYILHPRSPLNPLPSPRCRQPCPATTAAPRQRCRSMPPQVCPPGGPAACSIPLFPAHEEWHAKTDLVRRPTSPGHPLRPRPAPWAFIRAKHGRAGCRCGAGHGLATPCGHRRPFRMQVCKVSIIPPYASPAWLRRTG